LEIFKTFDFDPISLNQNLKTFFFFSAQPKISSARYAWQSNSFSSKIPPSPAHQHARSTRPFGPAQSTTPSFPLPARKPCTGPAGQRSPLRPTRGSSPTSVARAAIVLAGTAAPLAAVSHPPVSVRSRSDAPPGRILFPRTNSTPH
jgi:hypothetical protein